MHMYRIKRKQDEMRVEIQEKKIDWRNEAKPKVKERRNDTFLGIESHYGRIRKGLGGKWACTRCPYKREEEKSLTNHLAMEHRAAHSGAVKCPKCEKYPNMQGTLNSIN